MSKKYIFKLMLSVLFICTLAGSATAAQSLQEQINELKERLEINDARIDEGESNFGDLMNIGGYVDFEYIATDKAGETNEFRSHHLSLIFSKEIDKTWSFFAEVEFEDAPFIELENHRDGKLFIEVMTLQASLSQQLNFRAGRYLTPAGLWNVDHYPPFVTTQERPKHIRKIFPQIMDGLQAFGSRDIGNTLVDYALYVGNGTDEPGKNDTNENKAVGARVKFKFHSLAGVELGLSGFTGKDKQTSTQKYDRESFGADLKFRIKKLKFQGEYAKAAIDDQISPTATDFDREGYYGQAIYDIKKLSLVYRYDWYQADDTDSTSKTRTNTAAINYHFTPSVVGKLENHWVDPSSGENYMKAIASVAIFLGKAGR